MIDRYVDIKTLFFLTPLMLLLLFMSAFEFVQAEDIDPIVVDLGEEANGWTTGSPRAEIAPAFVYIPPDSPDGTEELILATDDREGLVGYWRKSFEVEGGRWTTFSVERKLEDVESPRRAALVIIEWLDAEGRSVRLFPESLEPNEQGPGQFVPSAWPPTPETLEGASSEMARPEFPRDQTTSAEGWTLVQDSYLVPENATQAVVELQLRWEPHAAARWRNVRWDVMDEAPKRKVRLATIHFRPGGTDEPLDNIDQFDPLLAEAAAQNADLVVLGEAITMVGHSTPIEDLAEPIPGPSTEALGRLAKQHGLYIVAGLTEREEHLVYNVAVLIGPDGELIGKYRKACLPREETAKGIMPGDEYPVFDTPLGKIGMMICWDVFFPEVARGLANNGAEVIALPIWGGHPALAQARAIENQCYIVTSTYTGGDQWMRSGVLDPTGQWLATAEEQGEVVVVEVDLNKRYYNRFLGDFRGRIPHERP